MPIDNGNFASIKICKILNESEMVKNIINPWSWQDERNYVQAVEVKNIEGTLYVSGQTAISDEGISSNEDMRSQLIQTIQSLEKVIRKADYELKNIVRLNIYTTSNTELLENFDIIQNWITENKIKQTSTVLEVKSLFETLKVEFEATVVK
ncbi:RidA family protein [Pontibacter chinhatensis]|nr:RidA family protein [Pontibacter chinhatensis]